MSKSQIRILSLLFVVFLCESCRCQDLDYLPPIVNKKPFSDSSFSFVLNTMTNNFENKYAVKPFLNSVQIVDADQPWPPRWYSATPLYTHDEFVKDSIVDNRQNNFIIDAKAESNYFSFFKLVALLNDSGFIKKDVQGYIMLNKAMEPVDTIGPTLPNTEAYWHDYRINKKGERLMDIKIYRPLDLRKATENPADSAIGSAIDVIQILDNKNKVKFSWVSTEKLDPNVFEFKASLKAKIFAAKQNGEELVNWSHLTSAIWDYDDNILYALRFIGIGKIDRNDGHVIWKIDFKDLPVISGKDTITWEFPHDFELISQNDTAARYSLYALGAAEKTLARAVIFDINKKTNKITLVKYIYPSKHITGVGQGSFDFYDDHNYLFSYGFYDYGQEDTTFFVDAGEYVKNGQVASILQLPRNIQVYKIHRLDDWPRPVRPEIILKNGVLEAKGQSKDWTWYELSGKDLTQIKKLATGKTLKPEKRKKYCVAGKYGIGYAVSRPYSY